MSIEAGPNEVTSGLIFCIDTTNTKKSWIGAPITNQFLAPTPTQNGDVTFAVNGTGTFKRITGGTFDGYSITQNDVVYRYDLGVTGCHYHGNVAAVPSGVYVTWTFDYYISPDAANYPTTNYLANVEGPGSMAITSPNSNKGIWQSIRSTSALTTSSGNSNLLLYPGACSSSYLASSGYILYKNPQVTFTSYSPTVGIPFVNGTRSSSQSLLDMVSKNTITANNIVYAADGTFSFNGSSSNYTIANNTIFDTQTPTVEAWIKPSTLTQNGFIFEKGAVNTQYSLFIEGSSIVWRQASTAGGYTNLTTSTSAMTVNQWNHVVGTFESGSRKIYVNGVQVASDTQVQTLPVNASGETIGMYNSGGYYYNGSIGVVRVYNRVLTATEVSQNFQGLRTRYGI
ncbi:Concanavalin A-like lectin/glucanases superfamily [uncultured Caudovirales phage]|uniref:Concanavalin A-like lectin/glucanases superfamily n=1 Tax=uncultured Caudovirales phage TaxID=2100421 RepID=A0A6J5NRD5_9CAUD|nr:Concanavalin A-like lectin/glucanases superfamily [uncultured Caudovirales phage]